MSTSDNGVLAVDFGTSNTVAVLGRDGHGAEPLLFDGSPTLPSAVFAAADGRILTGRDAQRAAASDPARCEPNPKRRVDDGTVLLADRELPVEELIAAVLGRVVAEARRATGGDVTRLVLTHPAVWGGHRIRPLLAAADRVLPGVAPILTPEPVAAAHRFTASADTTALVYDLGGGTCDVTVVAARGGDLAVLASDGLADFGGLDVDHAIVEYLRRRLPDPSGWARLEVPSDAAGRRDRRLLWEDVREVKELLSRESYASLYLPVLDVDTHLTRRELDELAAPLLTRSIGVARDLAAANGAEAVYLTGGGARMPLVATALLRSLGIAPVLTEQPELVIATGALSLAAPHRPEPGTAAVPTADEPVNSAVFDGLAEQRDAALAWLARRDDDPFSTVRPGYAAGDVELFLDRAHRRLRDGDLAYLGGYRPEFTVADSGYDRRRVHDFLRRLETIAPDLTVAASRPRARPGEEGAGQGERAARRVRPEQDGSGTEAWPGDTSLPVGYEEVRDRRFAVVRLRHGYDIGEVDDFLNQVEERLRSGLPPLSGPLPYFAREWLFKGYDCAEVDAFVRRLARASD